MKGLISNKKGGAPVEQFVGFVAYIIFIAFAGFILYISIKSEPAEVQYVNNGIVVEAQKYLREFSTGRRFSTDYYEEIIKAHETKDQKLINNLAEDFFNYRLGTATRGWLLVFKNSDNTIPLRRIGSDDLINNVLVAENYIPLKDKKDYIKLELYLGERRGKGEAANYDIGMESVE